MLCKASWRFLPVRRHSREPATLSPLAGAATPRQRNVWPHNSSCPRSGGAHPRPCTHEGITNPRHPSLPQARELPGPRGGWPHSQAGEVEGNSVWPGPSPAPLHHPDIWPVVSRLDPRPPCCSSSCPFSSMSVRSERGSGGGGSVMGWGRGSYGTKGTRVCAGAL